MIDSSQILIIAAITIMTAIMTVIGIQLVLVLKEVRSVLKRINAIVDAVEKVGFSISHGSAEIIGFVTGMKKLLTVVDTVSQHSKKKKNAQSTK